MFAMVLLLGMGLQGCSGLLTPSVREGQIGRLGGLQAARKVFTVEIPLGDGYVPSVSKLRPLFENSEMYTVEYPIPFDLNVAPQKGFPAPVMSADGAMGERKGDALRLFTCWTKGFAESGTGNVASDILSFVGAVEWKKSLFDCTGAPFSQVVDALLSNTPEKSDSVTLLFERPLDSE